MTNHDRLYHRIFGHPGLAAQFLTEFVSAPLIASFDLDRLERLNAKFHSDRGPRREGDLI